MRTTRSRSPLQHGLAWLFWLALLLPLAQSAAAWHAYGHAATEAAGDSLDKKVRLASHCDLCLTAAAATGGPLQQSGPALPQSAARHQPPAVAAAGVRLAFSPPAYRSRAPPASR